MCKHVVWIENTVGGNTTIVRAKFPPECARHVLRHDVFSGIPSFMSLFTPRNIGVSYSYVPSFFGTDSILFSKTQFLAELGIYPY